MLRALASLTAAALLAVAGPAVAAAAADTFHAAPGATTPAPPCTAAAPCPLDVAMGAAAAADDAVLLAGGTYDLNALAVNTPSQSAGTLAPEPGARPRITGEGGLLLYGTRVRDLTLATTGSYRLYLSAGSVAERLVVDHRGAIAGDVAVLLWDSSTLRDSVVVERADGAGAIEAGALASAGAPAVLENVTAIAAGTGAIGIQAWRPPGMYCAPAYDSFLRVRNTIARGTLADLATRVASEDGSCNGGILLDVDTTNYRTLSRSADAVSTITLGTGNQTAPAQTDDAAVFADSAYRQRPTSATVDAGVADAGLGTADPDGDARVVDGRPDIGADEMIAAPAVATTAAALFGPSSGELRGTAIPAAGTRLTAVRFEHGATTAYGSATDARDAGGGVFAAALAGVPAGTLLHHRLVATAANASGTQSRTGAGADAALLFPLPSPAPPAPVPSPKPLPKLKAATVIKLGAPARSCASRRTLTLRFAAPKGTKIVKAAITVRGKTTTYTGKRLKPQIDLRGLPKGRFTVKVKVTLADGRVATLTKAYKTCVKAKRKAR